MWAGSACKLESPLGIAGGPVGWWDGGDPLSLYTDAGSTLVSADNQQVYRIADKSVNAYHLDQSTLAKRATYKTGIRNGFSVLRFDGGDDRYLGGMANYDKIDVFFVHQQSGATGPEKHIAWDDGSAGTLGYFGTGNDGANSTFDYVVGHTTMAIVNRVATTGTGYNLYEIGYDNTNATLIKNGVTLDTTAGTLVSDMTRFAIGSRSWVDSGFLTGDFCEAVVFGTHLSAYDRHRVEAYLMAKWGITA